MLVGLLILGTLSLGLFTIWLIREQVQVAYSHAEQRLAYEANSVAMQSGEALLQERPGWIGLAVKMMGEEPTVSIVRVTDPTGNVLFVSQGEPEQYPLEAAELAQISLCRHEQPRVFYFDAKRMEAVRAIYTGADLRGYAWVEFDRGWVHEQIKSILRDTVVYGGIWTVATVLLILLMGRSISRPLAVLHRGTRALMLAPESVGNFPLPVRVHNEIGDLIEAFNRMFASLAEQRSGLNDTLSLVSSMLANAPIGLALFDSNCRFVRVNQVFADLTGAPLHSHLGRTLTELLPQPIAQNLENAVLRVFADEEPVRDLEMSGKGPKAGLSWTWLASAYPVRTTPQQVRWVGMILIDATKRKHAEETLRKTEKLAVTGRLAAAIAHEINNPLEAITNLLFLLKNHCQLQDPALNYVGMAEQEVSRITEITQQTLRFYRQSTLPTRAAMSELLDSILNLYQRRLSTLNIQLERQYDPNMDLFCFAGEIRQVFANLVANSVDATSTGGRLLVRAHRSHNWENPSQPGVRFTVADTGSGMDPEVREHAFEAFFTTKEVTGTGLGLWVSIGIVRKHHGLMRVRSRTAAQGKSSGTVFQFFIPDDPNLVEGTQQASK
jgi:PAS domain S-box-containing protein